MNEDLLNKALVFAINAHAGMTRKGTDIPYIANAHLGTFLLRRSSTASIAVIMKKAVCILFMAALPFLQAILAGKNLKE